MSATVLKSGVYFIQNVGSGTVLDLFDGSSADGTPVQGFAKRNLSEPFVPAQLWIVSKVSEVYTIENANGRTYMELTSDVDGTRVTCNQYTGNANQLWHIVRNTENTGYVIWNQETSTNVDLQDGDPADGTPVNGYHGETVNNTNTNELWNFLSVYDEE